MNGHERHLERVKIRQERQSALRAAVVEFLADETIATPRDAAVNHRAVALLGALDGATDIRETVDGQIVVADPQVPLTTRAGVIRMTPNTVRQMVSDFERGTSWARWSTTDLHTWLTYAYGDAVPQREALKKHIYQMERRSEIKVVSRQGKAVQYTATDLMYERLANEAPSAE